MAATWKHYSAKQDLYSDPKRKDWFRNIPWKKTLTLATNTYASCRQIQVAEFNQCYSLASELSLDSSIILFSAKQRIFTAILGIHLKLERYEVLCLYDSSEVGYINKQFCIRVQYLDADYEGSHGMTLPLLEHISQWHELNCTVPLK